MRHRLASIVHTHTFRQSVVTTFSTFASAGLGAIFYLVLARVFGPESYGLFSLALTVMMAVSSFVDLGISTSLVRFVAANRQDHHYFPYAKLALRLKITTGLISCLLLLLFARPISLYLVHQPDLVILMPIVAVGVICLLLYSFSLAVFQGLAKYIAWGSLQIISNLLRLILLAGAIIFGLSNYPHIGLILFVLPLISLFLVSWKNINYHLLFSRLTPEIFKEFWGFNKWTAAFVLVSALVTRLDTFYTARYSTLAQLGIYSLAQTMVSFLPQLSSAIGAVTTTKFAGFTNLSDATNYLRKALPFSAGVSFLVTLIMIPAALLVIQFTGRDYSAAAIPFVILLLSLFIFVSTNPLRDIILYYFHKPQFFFWAGLGQGVIITLSAIFTIPNFGIVGSAVSVLAGHILLAITSIWYYHRQVRLNS